MESSLRVKSIPVTCSHHLTFLKVLLVIPRARVLSLDINSVGAVRNRVGHNLWF